MAKCKHLILVHRAELFQYGGRPVVTVRLVEAEDLDCTGQCEEKDAGTDEPADVRVPASDVHYRKGTFVIE
jgi:hypothetical protein